MPSPEPPAARLSDDLLAGRHRLGGVGEHLGRDQGCGGGLRGGRVPGELPQGHPVAVGGQQRDGLALDLDPHTGEHRQQLVAAGGHDDLRDGVGEDVTGHRPGRLRQGRQGRVVRDRQGLQGEAGAAADQLDVVAVGGDVDRLGGQAPGDVGEQPAGDQGLALVGDLGLDGDLGAGLVVEAGQHHARRRRPGPAARRGSEHSAWSAGCGRPTAPPQPTCHVRVGSSHCLLPAVWHPGRGNRATDESSAGRSYRRRSGLAQPRSGGETARGGPRRRPSPRPAAAPGALSGPAGVPVNSGLISNTRSSTPSRVISPRRSVMASPASRLYSLTRTRQPGLSSDSSPRISRASASRDFSSVQQLAAAQLLIQLDGDILGVVILIASEELAQEVHWSSGAVVRRSCRSAAF